ncbi:MAG: DAK2 domain-containing protein [Eubacteriales bacterium]|nr:DAK2 domain-containing protein [Eubacteriales bacterium]
MSTPAIDGKTWLTMLLSGAALLAAHAEELNAMNVFPVSDGDTGTNMTRTMEGGLDRIGADAEAGVGTVLEGFARGALLSARGNSGVILSQIFAGVSEELASCQSVTAADLVRAYRKGVARSYAAVQNPTEGTILTVFRESTEYAAAALSDGATIEDFFRLHVEEAQRSLASTKERLAVLAEADVVDSGAAGYLYIAEGMNEALNGRPVEASAVRRESAPVVDVDRFTRDSKLEFGYCTEFLLRLTTAKVDPDAFDIQTMLSVLDELGGESVVAYKQDDVVKVHVHTFTPGRVLERAQAFGEFLTVKIENMSLGHTETARPAPKIRKPYAVVAVAAGDGMAALFRHLGADEIVSGGTTSNPSAEDFLEAFRRCGAEHILVLPDHKNIMMAAQQAAELYEAADVRVIPAKSFMQGYAALSVITPGLQDVDAIAESAGRAAGDVTDAEITRAVRDAAVGGVEVKKGDYIALSAGGIRAAAGSASDAVMAFLAQAEMDFVEIITLFVGKAVSLEERARLTDRIETAYPDCSVEVYEGGQDVYDYYLALE